MDNPPTLNVMKAGAGVAVKFSLNGDQGLNIFAEGYPLSQEMPCASAAPTDAIEELVGSETGHLTYDVASDTYVYHWKTKKGWAGSCRQLTLRLSDGTDHTAHFKFK